MKTSWSRVLIAIAAGYAVCFQLGKVPAALPLIGDEFGLALWQRGAIVSSLSLLTAAVGILVGLWANRYRAERSALLALTVAAAAGLAGAATTGFLPLLLTRIVEGLGYIMAMASLPAIVANNAAPEDRAMAMAGWGSAVPGGIATLLLASPLLIETAGLGWRGLWLVTAMAIAGVALVIALCLRPAASDRDHVAAPPPLADLRQAIQPRSVALVGVFILFSVQFLAVVSFLPTMLVEQSGMTLASAGFFSGLVAVGNAVGAILAGPLIKAGLRRRDIITAGYAVMGLASAVVLTEAFPTALRLAAALTFSTAGAFIPGTIWTFVPELASRPSQAPIFAGMFIQGAGIGQIAGPILLGGLVDYFGGWHYAVLLTATASLAGIALVRLGLAGR